MSEMRTAELQSRLRALGLDPGPTDGVYGPLTEEAVFDSLDLWAPKIETPAGIVPIEWMPECDMDRIIAHWTAGAHKASSHDVACYHILIEADGRLVRGSYSIKDNVDTGDGRYAAHTKSCNTKSIGTSLCCMHDAVENPFDPGHYPMTKTQWDIQTTVIAELCNAYGIAVTDKTVLSHGEVEKNLGKPQAGKWDYTRLAFAPEIKGAKACGDKLRAEVKAKMSGKKAEAASSVEVQTASSPEPTVIP